MSWSRSGSRCTRRTTLSLERLPGKLDLKGKRKKLPTRTREALEDEQRSVMEQYRELKKQRLEAQQQQKVKI